MAKTLTLNLRNKLVKIHMTRRRAKAMDYLRQEIGRLEKVTPENVKLDARVNDYILKRVSKRFNPIKVNIDKSGDSVNVKLFEEKKQQAPAQEQKKDEKKTESKKGEQKTEVKKIQQPSPQIPPKKQAPEPEKKQDAPRTNTKV